MRAKGRLQCGVALARPCAPRHKVILTKSGFNRDSFQERIFTTPRLIAVGPAGKFEIFDPQQSVLAKRVK